MCICGEEEGGIRLDFSQQDGKEKDTAEARRRKGVGFDWGAKENGVYI